MVKEEQNKMYDMLRHYGHVVTDVDVIVSNTRITHYEYCGVLYMVIMQDGDLQHLTYVGTIDKIPALPIQIDMM